MRRLPVFLMLDVSDSMVGEPLDLLKKGVTTLVESLKDDPNAMETVYLSLSVFAGQVRELVPLTDLMNYQMPNSFPIGSGTALGKAIDFIANNIENNIIHSSKDKKGDWKPIVFLFTDGHPTDNYNTSIRKWKKKFKDKVNFIAISIGEQTDTEVLYKITSKVFLIKNFDHDTARDLFQWVSSSIAINSVKVNDTQDEIKLSKYEEDFMQTAPKHGKKDERFIILHSKCQNLKKPYIIKYEKNNTDYPISYKLDDDYLAMSSDKNKTEISVEKINIVPLCPYCENEIIVYCGNCQKLYCSSENAKKGICPWCNKTATLKYNSNFSIKQQLG